MTDIAIAHGTHGPVESLHAARLYHLVRDWNEAGSVYIDSDAPFESVVAGVTAAGFTLEFRNGTDAAVLSRAEVAVDVSFYGSGYRVSAFGCTAERVAAALRAVGMFIPERTYDNPDTVDVAFWSFDPMVGGSRYVRSLDRLAWEDTQRNYPSSVRATLADMCTWSAGPPSGRLMVFHGPPGTGKSRFLQTLAGEWSDWCSVHYVVDPDMMFSEANYMTRVMLGSDPGDRWRLIVVEDGDEFIDRAAKERTGYGVSRLLNLADGLVGQGLRVMVLVSTNVRNARFSKAIVRPGRCSALVEFPAFPADEASTWLAESGIDTEPPGGPVTLASLYAAATTGTIADDTDDDE